MPGPRIVLIHATPVAMVPIHDAMQAGWPDADVVNILDDSLSPDRARTPDLTEAMSSRFADLTRYGQAIGAAGILVTCSAFGPAIARAAAALPIPVLKPNEAMFRAAFGHGLRIGMLATFAPSIVTMQLEFAEEADAAASGATLRTVLVDGAMAALREGDVDAHNRLVAEAAGRLTECDAIMLAHFSTSRAADLCRERTAIPILTAPGSAVALMKTMVVASRAT